MGEVSPSFQLFPRDFLADTDNLTDAAVGLYIRLLCKQWMHGSLPEAFESDDDGDSMIDVLPLGDIKERRKSFRLLAKHFVPHPTETGRVAQSRLERIREEQRLYREQKALAGAIGGKQTQSRRQAQGVAESSTASISLQAESIDAAFSLQAKSSSASATATATAKTTGAPPPSSGRALRSEAWNLGIDVLQIGGEAGVIEAHRLLDPAAEAHREIAVAEQLLAAYGREAVLDRAKAYCRAYLDGRVKMRLRMLALVNSWGWDNVWSPEASKSKPTAELSDAGQAGLAAIEARELAAAARKAAVSA